MLILIIRVLCEWLLYVGYDGITVDETYLDWYYLRGGLNLEPNTTFKIIFTGIGITCEFLRFYYLAF